MATANGHRPAPADEHAETALLGAAILAADAAHVVATLLTPEDFYAPAHQLIAAGITELVAAGSAVDRTLLASQLGPQRLEKAGGDSKLADLQIRAGLQGSVDSYVTKILDARRRRQVLGVAYEVIEAAYDGDPSRKLDELRAVAGTARAVSLSAPRWGS
jgi:replicative DNA helicase